MFFNKKIASSVVVGSALFSMFFGSGNLIFPLMLGARFEEYFWLSALGFIVTAVILPTLGLIAMIPAHGRYERLLEGLSGSTFARYLFFITLLFWIPLGSGPRCAVLAHASLSRYYSVPLWLFSAVFLGLVFFIHNEMFKAVKSKYLYAR